MLAGAIRDGVGLLTWEQDSFAYAESYDETAKRYRGLRYNHQMSVTADDVGLLVKSAVARKQIDAETAATPISTGASGKPVAGPPTSTPTSTCPIEAPKPKRYHGTVSLDPARTGRDAGRIADEVIAHLVGLM